MVRSTEDTKNTKNREPLAPESALSQQATEFSVGPHPVSSFCVALPALPCSLGLFVFFADGS